MSKMRLRHVLLGTVSVFVSQPALAQEAVGASGPRADAAGQQSVGVDDIVVTARRREERLQDVPIAVTAITAEQLERSQVDDITDLAGAVPNVSITQGDVSNPVFYIRGVGQIDSLSFNDPGVGFYIDGVYIGRAQGALLDIVDPARVEVLRGPQGTLYGRNTIGGAINVVTARPTDEWTGYLTGTYGNYDRQSVRGMVSGPVVPGLLSTRISLAETTRSGFQEQLGSGPDGWDKRNVAGRAAFLLTPSSNFSAYLTADYTRSRPRTSRTPYVFNSIFIIPAGGLVAPTGDPFKIRAESNRFERLDAGGAALTLEYQAGDITFKSITSHRAMKYDGSYDLDNTAFPFFPVFVFEKTNQTTQELQAVYSSPKVSVTGGLFYFNEHDVTVGGYTGSAFSFGTFRFPFESGSRREQDTDSYAAYVQSQVTILPGLRAEVGLRYTNDTKDIDTISQSYAGLGLTAQQAVAAIGTPGIGIGPVASPSGRAKSDAFNPRFGLSYNATSDLLLYASVSNGYKSGGINGRRTDIAQAFGPESVWAYEGGVKADWFGRRLRTNLAVFYNDYQDLQVSFFEATATGIATQPILANAGGAHILGAELEVVAQPLSGLTISGNVGLLDSKYTTFPGPGGVDISKQRELVNSPKFSGRIGAVYVADLANAGSLTFSSALSHRSRTYVTVSTNPILSQPHLELLEGSITWTDRRGRLSIGVFGKNLLDKRYIEAGFDLGQAFPIPQLAYYGEPRTYGVTAKLSF